MFFQNRKVPHPNRVKLTRIGETDLYDIERAEGVPTVEGTPLNAETLNSLTNHNELNNRDFANSGHTGFAPIDNPNFTGTATISAITGLQSINGAKFRIDTLSSAQTPINTTITISSLNQYNLILFYGYMVFGGDSIWSSIVVPTSGISGLNYNIFLQPRSESPLGRLSLYIQNITTILVRNTPYSSGTDVYLRGVYGIKFTF